MERVTCSTCNKVVQPSRGYRCPECKSFLHPDPLKRLEADMAVELRRWIIDELPKPDEARRFDAVYKIVAMGEPGSGKTEILDTFVTGRFDQDYRRTLGIGVSSYDAKIDNHLFKLLIWDLAGQDIFRSLRT